MKHAKLLIFLFAAIIVGFTSCRKNSPGEDAAPKPDTEEQVNAKSKILGKWYIEKAVFTKYTDGQVSDTETFTEFDDTQFFDFKTETNLEISYSKKIGNFTYTFTEDAKTLKTSSPSDTYSVSVLTDTDMILVKEHTATSTTAKMTEEITFKKVAAPL